MTSSIRASASSNRSDTASNVCAFSSIKEDIIAFLQDKNVPGDEIVYSDLADEILAHTPIQGYLTISNALQWRLQYSRAIGLKNKVDGIKNYEW